MGDMSAARILQPYSAGSSARAHSRARPAEAALHAAAAHEQLRAAPVFICVDLRLRAACISWVGCNCASCMRKARVRSNRAGARSDSASCGLRIQATASLSNAVSRSQRRKRAKSWALQITAADLGLRRLPPTRGFPVANARKRASPGLCRPRLRIPGSADLGCGSRPAAFRPKARSESKPADYGYGLRAAAFHPRVRGVEGEGRVKRCESADLLCRIRGTL